MYRGYTVKGLQRRLERWRRAEELAHSAMEHVDRYFHRALHRFDASVKQAIADRYASIRVMTDEITELEKL